VWTEALQIAYSLFYAIFLVIGFELYRKDRSRFRYFRFAIVYGFLLSYIGYFFLPSAGPRFTLHDFSKTDAELPGLFVTPALRAFINVFENIHSGMSNSTALASVQRDVFPSGHTMMTIVAIALAYRYRLKVRHCMCILGLLLVVATVYLRYHYVVDLLAGAILAVLCLQTSTRIYRLFSAGEDV
jgi:membrane-associated phospholipid phosphatase